MAKSRLEKSWLQYNKGISIYLLDLIMYRDVSNQIASQFDIVHQSPQLIVIKSGEAVYNSSHTSINAEVVSRYS